MFFGDSNGKFTGSKTKQAVEICRGCRCARKCLSWALETGDQYSVLGGMTPPQRLKYKRELESDKVRKTGE